MKDIALEDPERAELQRRLKEVERDLESARKKLDVSRSKSPAAHMQKQPKAVRRPKAKSVE